MVVLWMLTLAVGIANGCVASGVWSDAVEVATAALEHHHGDHGTHKSDCGELCKKVASSMRSGFDGSGADALPVLALALAAAPIFVPVQDRLPLAAGAGPPLRAPPLLLNVFLRLAL